MTSLNASAPRTSARRDDVIAVQGARWVTAAWLAIGALNYGYALLLTRLLDVDDFATFAAGQALVLCAATVALVAIPWVLAQALARARSQAERSDAVRFSVVIAVTGGVLASATVALVATRFAGAGAVAALGGATLLIYVTRVSGGWLQGTERMRTLAWALTGEAVLKVVVGLFLVSVLGFGATGALAAFGVAAIPLLIWWPYRMTRGGGWWADARANRDLWRRALGLGTVQSLVALMASVDLVLITLLPADGPATASYQASVMMGRAPLFLAGAISVAFFPALSRRRMGTPLAGSAMRMYLIVALPLTAVYATTPPEVFDVVFPSDYGLISRLVVFTAVSGFAVGGINLVSTFFQAVNDQSCQYRQAVGVLLFVAGLLAGWKAAGVLGLAIGGCCGALAALLLVAHLLVRKQGFHVFAQLPLVEPIVVIGVLVALRPVPVVWLIAATAVAVLATVRFLRHRTTASAQGPSEASGPAQDTPGRPARASTASTGAADEPDAVGVRPGGGHPGDGHPNGDTVPLRLLLDAVWRRDVRPAGDDELRDALRVARACRTEALLARAYPRQLAATVTEVEARDAVFRSTAREATQRLLTAGVPSVLIKADGPGEHLGGDFDVVVPDGQWAVAERALSGWCVRRERYWLERSSKVLLWPASGPAAHLHASVGWFGVPVMPNARLFARARAVQGDPWLEPCPADRLCIWLAHALFQNLSFELSELLAVRPLLRPEVVAESRREAGREGWGTAHSQALSTAVAAIGRLDRGETVTLPVPLPVPVSLRVAAEHTPRLLREKHLAGAVREAALRVPLCVAKTRKRGTP
ncbi:lipopolysaccharide biosynthesis protein [Streptomyces actuosus]|uniref:Lipopolysaccharide biosynthesis protein n=1 Tax=Streptomyces actuosus TaxID=1885 RepID=A0ABS2VZ17_STRAS|nr:lipopolysaccharide biosynthesis protein [Streptomyces actuosus]MBN0048230.1 lipopolysaccharide biosynthesis protein [Streptomyces actuosus]